MNLNILLPWVLSLLLGCVVAGVFLLGRAEVDAQLDASGTEAAKARKSSLLLRLFYPLIVILAGFVESLPIDRHLEKVEQKLIRAGRPGGLSPQEFFACRFLAVVCGYFAGAYFDFELGLTPICALGLALLGFLYPDIWLKDAILKRRRRMFRDLPDLLDTLRLAVDAGFDLSSALAVAVERGRKGPLLEELELVDREVSLGRSRREAFRNFADRIAMAEVNAFVLALNQADQLGASIGPVLRAQSNMSRTKRWQLAEALVNKLPMKMLGPLVIFIFPSSFIILFTPLLIQWMQSK